MSDPTYEDLRTGEAAVLTARGLVAEAQELLTRATSSAEMRTAIAYLREQVELFYACQIAYIRDLRDGMWPEGATVDELGGEDALGQVLELIDAMRAAEEAMGGRVVKRSRPISGRFAHIRRSSAHSSIVGKHITAERSGRHSCVSGSMAERE